MAPHLNVQEQGAGGGEDEQLLGTIAQGKETEAGMKVEKRNSLAEVKFHPEFSNYTQRQIAAGQ